MYIYMYIHIYVYICIYINMYLYWIGIHMKWAMFYESPIV